MTTRLALCALALLGSACAARKAIVPEVPARASHPADLSDVALVIRSFVVEGLTHEDDTKLSTVAQLRHSFELYLTAQTRFRAVTSDPAGIRGARLYADVHLRPGHSAYRTWILDLPAVFPLTGYWPLTPQWGCAKSAPPKTWPAWTD